MENKKNEMIKNQCKVNLKKRIIKGEIPCSSLQNYQIGGYKTEKSL